MDKHIRKVESLNGGITVPADKSIAHRAVIFSALARGKSVIKNFSVGQDPKSSLEICKSLGVDYSLNGNTLTVNSTSKLSKPNKFLDCGNSGTTMRLMAGVLAGQNFSSTLTGDESLSKRPMKRIIEPLTQMGAVITSNDGHAPLKIMGSELNGINYKTPVPSAQVKSSILLAGLFADGETSVTEIYLSRNHTELMLSCMGADISTHGFTTTIKKSELKPVEFNIAGDISSAAFFIVAGLIVKNSHIILKNVGLNPTRCGILEVAEKMGANIKILDKKIIANEEVGDIEVKTSDLRACEISGEIIPRLIDEIPIIAVLATQAQGTTVIRNAQDLRNKESDRIKAIVTELRKLGADIEETPDGMVINGKNNLKGDCEVETYSDHRIAMSLYIAGLICEKDIIIKGFEWVNISFPEFEKFMQSLIK